MAHRKKPRDYDPILGRELIAYMKKHKLPLGKACSSEAHFPSYESAKRWLVLFEDFRNIYPRKLAVHDPRYTPPPYRSADVSWYHRWCKELEIARLLS